MSDILEPGEIIKPQVSLEDAKELLLKLYGLISVKVKEFNSYDDRNFFFKVDTNTSNPHLSSTWPHGYILKVTNKGDSRDPGFSDAQNEMILHMAEAGLAVPEPVKNLAGNLKSLETLKTNNKDSQNIVRLLKFIPGKTFYEIETWTTAHFYQCGEFLARMDKSLEAFKHPAYNNRNSIWFLSSIPAVKDFVSAVTDDKNRKLVVDIIDQFCETVVPASSQLEKGIIHGDFNEQNILCQKNEGSGEFEIFSVIDFGDSQYNPLLYEVSIAVMYMMTKCTVIPPAMAGGHVLAGYIKHRDLPPVERQLLRTCVAARYAQSLVMGAYSYSQDPGNEYLLITAKTGWKTLSDFWSLDQAELYKEWDNIISMYNSNIDTTAYLSKYV